MGCRRPGLGLASMQARGIGKRALKRWWRWAVVRPIRRDCKHCRGLGVIHRRRLGRSRSGFRSCRWMVTWSGWCLGCSRSRRPCRWPSWPFGRQIPRLSADPAARARPRDFAQAMFNLGRGFARRRLRGARFVLGSAGVPPGGWGSRRRCRARHRRGAAGSPWGAFLADRRVASGAAAD
jgi:hypothetical protein